MINKSMMQKLADEAIKQAPNEDWKHNGGCSQSGALKIIPVKDWNKYLLGVATVGFFKFKKPFTDGFHSSFVGFTLAAMEAEGKIVSDTHSVIDKIESDDYCAGGLVHRFCPKCHSLDSVKSTSRRAGPECVHITYRCKKCSYIDFDVLD